MSSKIYTNAGSVIVAVNPFCDISNLYGPHQIVEIYAETEHRVDVTGVKAELCHKLSSCPINVIYLGAYFH